MMGVGAALSEALHVDPRLGCFVNHDLAGYEVPVHAEYAVEAARQLVFSHYGAEAYSRGLDVHLTIRAADQEVAYRALRRGLLNYEQRQWYRGPEAYVDLPAGTGLRAGSFLQGSFEQGAGEALHVPQSAVQLREGFGLAAGRLVKQSVQPRRIARDRIALSPWSRPRA